MIIFSLPPNTTHLTQPLDKGVFGPLKSFWSEACHRFVAQHPGMAVTKYTFSAVFSEVWIEAMRVRNIISSFRTTGVYPPDRNVIKLPDEVMPNLAKKTCLALHTPLHSHEAPSFRPLFCKSFRRGARRF